MLIYSKNIIRFMNEIKTSLKEVLSKEMGLRVSGDRFYNKSQTSSYPLSIAIFNNRPMLGYYDPMTYELGFHECLMSTKKETLQNIIRHELAHCYIFLHYGDTVDVHGVEFRAFCQLMGWSPEVQKATICLDDSLNIPIEEENNVLRKVQKLMALATSSNTHEAEQAMIKSQQLLLKHNIDLNNCSQDEEKVFVKRVIKQKRENAKLRSISQILKTFFVSTVYNKFPGFLYLEVIGSATNVEIAEYIAVLLQQKLDDLWNQAKKRSPTLKGAVAKNSFFLGVAFGYCNKIDFLKRDYDNNTSNALILIEKKLEDAKKMIYERLTYGTSRGNYCSKSSLLGEQAGKSLSLNPAINSHTKNSGTYLTYQN